jgi:predicted nucleotidyltransferase
MEINKENLEQYSIEHGIKFLVFFGSQAAGTGRKDSDYDIAVFTTKEGNIVNFDNYIDLLDFLSNLLGIPNNKIDITNLNKANTLHRYEVILSGILLYGDEDEYAAYKAFAFKEYIDSHPLFTLEKFLIKKRQKLLKETISQPI